MENRDQKIAIIAIISLVIILSIITISYLQLVDIVEKFGINKIKEIEFKENQWFYTEDGWISNSDRQINHAVPGDRLYFQIILVSKVPYDVTLEQREFQVLFNDETVFPTRNFGDMILKAGQEQRMNGDFFTTKEGIHELEWSFQLRDENGTGDYIVETDDIDAWSLTNVLQEEDNKTNQFATYAAITIGAVTAIALFVSIWYNKKHVSSLKTQNKLLYDANVLATRESQTFVKADLRINLVKSDNRTRRSGDKETKIFHLAFDVKNIGTVQAESVNVYYKIYDQSFSNLKDILKDKIAIQKTRLDTQGDILPNASKSYTISKNDLEPKLRYVILWIHFAYHEFEDNMIFQIEIQGGEDQHMIFSTFSNDAIELETNSDKK